MVMVDLLGFFLSRKTQIKQILGKEQNSFGHSGDQLQSVPCPSCLFRKSIRNDPNLWISKPRGSDSWTGL